MPSVSVIIPVSRARDYVAATVSSLLKQTLDDLELVFVDGDGSDGSISLIHEITDSYSGPKKIVFTGDGKDDGPGVARNKGIDAATGDFITFTDSDDIVDPEYCQSLLDAALSCGADLAYCNICMDRTDSGKGRIKANPPVTGGPFLDSERRRFLVNFVSYFSTFLYRRSFLLENGIRFPHPKQRRQRLPYLLPALCHSHCRGKQASLPLHPEALYPIQQDRPGALPAADRVF